MPFARKNGDGEAITVGEGEDTTNNTTNDRETRWG
jgi:hypothetical protein